MAVSREQTQAKLDLLASGVTRHVPEQTYLVPDRFEEFARQYPDKAFLFYNGQQINFSELNQRANQYAHVAKMLGMKNGDVGSVMIENRPEFFYAWLGLAKIGATASLINTQARGESLRHAIEETASKILYLGNECASLFATVPGLGATVKTLCVADGDNQANELCADMDSLGHYLTTASDQNPAPSGREVPGGLSRPASALISAKR